MPSACEKSHHPDKHFRIQSHVLQLFVFRNAVLQLLFLKAGCALFQMCKKGKKGMGAKGGLEELLEPCKDLPTTYRGDIQRANNESLKTCGNIDISWWLTHV